MEYPGYSIYYSEKSAETIEEDSLILFDFLTNECKINNKDIIVCGRSIGTGPATYLASKRKPGALILISPIKSLRDTVKNLIGPLQYLVRNRFNNYERISEVTCPLLIIHGQKDSLIPFEDSIKLCEKTAGPYELVLPENMNHNDVHIYDDFFEPIQSFLKRHNMLNFKEKEINIEDFRKIEMRVAEIIKCEEIKKSKKLYKLELNLGFETRTVCSGIKAFFTPEELTGKRVILVTNLAPAKLCGVESNGMILAATVKNEGNTEQLTLITPEKDIPLGSRVS